MTSSTEETGVAQAARTEKPKPGKKARVATTRAHVAAKKAKTAKKGQGGGESAYGQQSGA